MVQLLSVGEDDHIVHTSGRAPPALAGGMRYVQIAHRVKVSVEEGVKDTLEGLDSLVTRVYELIYVAGEVAKRVSQAFIVAIVAPVLYRWNLSR